MSIHTFCLTVIAVVTWSFPAAAASWREVSVTSDQVVYADTINVLRRGNFVRAWEREVYANEQEGEGLADLYKSVKVLTHYDCARRTSTPVIRIYYRSDGVEIRRFRVEGLMTPAPIEPDTPRDTIFGDLCPSKVAEMAKAGPTPADEHAAKPHSDKPKMKSKKHAKSKSHKKAKSSKKAKSQGKVKSKKSAKHTPGPHEAHPVKGGRIEAAANRMDSVMTHEVHWTYDGATSPENWGDLKPEWARCGSGELQSPIDIRDGARLSLAPIRFEYRPSLLRLIDNGHTVQANYSGGSAITVGGTRYELLQMHFHKPSEARVNGRVYDMVAHIVHRSGDGRLAVVAVMFEIGAENTFINSMWPHLPLEKNREVILPDIKMSLDSLLPVDRGYYTFMGSLTTPPCTEGVLWMVMKSPVSISPNQVGVFSRLYPMNARPVQASNGRFIKESM